MSETVAPGSIDDGLPHVGRNEACACRVRIRRDHREPIARVNAACHARIAKRVRQPLGIATRCAARAYEPEPAAFPTTLVHVGEHDLVPRARALAPECAVVKVRGDHFTMLLMPDVLELAEVVTAWADAAIAEEPVPAE